MTIAQKDEAVDLQRLGQGLGLVTLRRPQARNAITPRVALLLEQIVTEIERSDEIRVAILTGEGDRAFCAGADLNEVAAGRLDQCFTEKSGFAGFVNAKRSKPWIAAVNGPALAGGFEIVLACDLAVAADSATFGLPEVKRGLIASAGGLYRLPRVLPRVLAMEMIATGRTIGADRALAAGVINRVTELRDLLEAAQELGLEICANAPLAVRESVRIVRAASGFEDEQLRSDAERAQSFLQASDDYWEGARAFLEKRPPVWKAR
jgi:enoyl-CoA hydratase/carnithine racemase